MEFTQADMDAALSELDGYINEFWALPGQYVATSLFRQGSGGGHTLISKKNRKIYYTRGSWEISELRSSANTTGDQVDDEPQASVEVSVYFMKDRNNLDPNYISDARALYEGKCAKDVTADPEFGMIVAQRMEDISSGLKVIAGRFVRAMELECAKRLSQSIPVVPLDGIPQNAPGAIPAAIDATALYGGSWADPATDIPVALAEMAEHHREVTNLPVDLILFSPRMDKHLAANEGIVALLVNNSAIPENFGMIPVKMIPGDLSSADHLKIPGGYKVKDTGTFTYYFDEYTIVFLSFEGGIQNALKFASQGNEINDYAGGQSVHMWIDNATEVKKQSCSTNFMPVVLQPHNISIFDVSPP